MSSYSDVMPDPLTRKFLVDEIEMLCYGILMHGDALPRHAIKEHESLKYLFNALGEKKRQCGRLYCRYRLAKIFAATCIRNPFPSKGSGEIEDFKKLAKWDRGAWSTLEGALKDLKELLVRKDAEWLDEQSNEIHPVRGHEASGLYTTQLEKVLRLIRVQHALSNIRLTLEEQVRSEENEGTPDVEPEDVAEFAFFVEDNFNDDLVAKNALRQLLVRSESEEGSDIISLVPLDRLDDIFKCRPFCLEKFQKSLTHLLRRWAIDVFGERPPTLVRLGYLDHTQPTPPLSQEEDNEEGSQEDDKELEDSDLRAEEESVGENQQPSGVARMPDTGSSASNESHASTQKRRSRSKSVKRKLSPREVDSDLVNLRNVRTNLADDFDDPLDQCRKIAASAVTGKRAPSETSSPKKKRAKMKNINEKKPSAKELEFDDSDEEDSEEEDNEVKLSELPKRAKAKTPKKPAADMPDPPLLNPDGTKKRRKFSDDEKRAIREGVKKFGFGKWAEIKGHYSIILRNRTSVNIKDCYRTMMRRGEV